MGQKIYKFNQKQLGLIIENQKKDKQLQLEMFDATGNAFGKLLTFAFKQSVSAFKYLSGIGVNVYSGEGFSPDGRIKVKKNNPLAPLSLYNPTLAGLPKNYQNIFKTIYQGLLTISDEDVKSINNNDEQDVDVEKQLENQLDKYLVFNSLDKDGQEIIYNIKFEFSNLDKTNKLNSTIMMSTWSLKFKVTANDENVSKTNTNLKFELTSFSSSPPSLAAIMDKFAKEVKNNPKANFEKEFEKYQQSTNEVSLIFSDQSQANKFSNVMKNQIDSQMKTIISQLNTKLKSKNLIKQPTITVDISENLTGISKEPIGTPEEQIKSIDGDIIKLKVLVKKYKNGTTPKEKTFYTKVLQVLKTLIWKKKILNQT